MLSNPLFAALLADARGDPLRRPEVIWGTVGLAAALLVGAAVVYLVDNWRKQAAAGPTEADKAAALTSYREMYDGGEITEAEYAELRRRVAERVRPVPPKPEPPPLEPPPPAGTA